MKLAELNNRLEKAVNQARQARDILSAVESETRDLANSVKHSRQRDPLTDIADQIEASVESLSNGLDNLEAMFLEKNALLIDREQSTIQPEQPKRSFWNPFA